MEYINKNDLIAQIEHDIETGKIARPTAAYMLRYVSNIPVVNFEELIPNNEFTELAIALYEFKSALARDTAIAVDVFRKLLSGNG